MQCAGLGTFNFVNAGWEFGSNLLLSNTPLIISMYVEFTVYMYVEHWLKKNASSS